MNARGNARHCMHSTNRMKTNRLATLALLALLAASSLSGPGCSDDASRQPFAKCGNGVIDGGERCDDGNLDDGDACLSTCVPAVCGDGIVRRGTEQCDGADLGGQTCASLGFDAGKIVCRDDCSIDPSTCGARRTHTPTAITATPTRSRTPTATSVVNPCGNGLLEADETCESCPADCQVADCEPSAGTFDVQVELILPPGQDVSTVTLLLGYRGSVASLPGSGAATTVRQRVSGTPPNSLVQVNDRDYALTLVASRAAGIASGRLARVAFDTCAGAAPPALADFACRVEGCSGRFGPIGGCGCRVSLP